MLFVQSELLLWQVTIMELAPLAMFNKLSTMNCIKVAMPVSCGILTYPFYYKLKPIGSLAKIQ